MGNKIEPYNVMGCHGHVLMGILSTLEGLGLYYKLWMMSKVDMQCDIIAY